MSRTSIALALIATAAVSYPGISSAQDWLGRIARNAAETAAQGAVNNALSGAANGSSNSQPASQPASTSPSPSQAPRRPQPQVMPSTNFADPAPINYTPSLDRPSDLRFAPEHAAAKRAYEDFGKVRCNDCEGGYDYETWVRNAIPGLTGYQVFERRIGGMAVGESLNWTGSRGARYALTIVGEQPIGEWPCKQLKWTADRGSEHAERMGLFCRNGNTWVDVL